MTKTLAIDAQKLDAELFRSTGEKKIIATIPAGSQVEVVFDQTKPMLMTIIGNGVSIRCRSAKWNRYFKNKNMPTMKTIEKWSCDGICKSLAGHTVEPDGWSYDGTPSWMLAMGMI